MKAYLLIALFSKVLKSLFEVLCYFIVDGAKYANFIVCFHQTQLFSNWMLSGFSSAGYHYYGDKPSSHLHKNSLFLLVINLCLIIIIGFLISFFFKYKINTIALLSGFLFSICITSSIYYRSHGLLIKSITILELFPFLILLISILLVSNTYTININYLLLISFLVPAIYCVIKIHSCKVKKNESFNIDIYKTTLPFFAVSAFNMFLSKADTSVLFYFASKNDINSYIISSRISGLILSFSYIFQHLFLPDIIKYFKSNLLDQANRCIKKYIKYSFVFGLFTTIIFSFLYSLDIFLYLGLNIDFKVLITCCLFYLIITPFSIFTYLLIIKKHLIIVLIFSTTGFGLTVFLIFIFKNRLDNIHIAIIFLSSISVIKVLEYSFYRFNYSNIKKI